MLLERRALAGPITASRPGPRIRRAGQASSSVMTATGYGAKFFDPRDRAGTSYWVADEHFEERIRPSAFTAALARPDDVVLNFAHAGQPLARTTAGTLRLAVDHVGLRWDASLVNTTLGRDVAELVRARLLWGCSFSFVPTEVSWEQEGHFDIRWIESCLLYDVCICERSAYKTATIIGHD